MTKIALVVGIDDYTSSPLTGCVSDAHRVGELLKRDHDDTPNFECRELTSAEEDVTCSKLHGRIEELFNQRADVALLYFAGHGTVNNLGGYLVTQDARKYADGVRMGDVLTMANESPATERIIILDCCHSGALGQIPAIANDSAVLREGVSALSASRDSEPAVDTPSGGLFTGLLCDALNGGASDVCGKVTVASAYAYVDEALGGWEQRPLFKSHVSKLVPLRTCAPAVEFRVLRLLPRYFSEANAVLPLDPSYEPTEKPAHAEHEAIFAHLQKFQSARLVVPVGEDHMYYAAINSKGCKLTPLGVHYWRLANSGKL